MTRARSRRATARSLLAPLLACFVLLGLGAVQKAPCVDDHMSGQRYATRLCYSDIPSFYPERGLHLGSRRSADRTTVIRRWSTHRSRWPTSRRPRG